MSSQRPLGTKEDHGHCFYPSGQYAAHVRLFLFQFYVRSDFAKDIEAGAGRWKEGDKKEKIKSVKDDRK